MVSIPPSVLRYARRRRLRSLVRKKRRLIIPHTVFVYTTNRYVYLMFACRVNEIGHRGDRRVKLTTKALWPYAGKEVYVEVRKLKWHSLSLELVKRLVLEIISNPRAKNKYPLDNPDDKKVKIISHVDWHKAPYGVYGPYLYGELAYYVRDEDCDKVFVRIRLPKSKFYLKDLLEGTRRRVYSVKCDSNGKFRLRKLKAPSATAVEERVRIENISRPYSFTVTVQRNGSVILTRKNLAFHIGAQALMRAYYGKRLIFEDTRVVSEYRRSIYVYGTLRFRVPKRYARKQIRVKVFILKEGL